MKVVLVNPEVVQNTLERIGDFASICKGHSTATHEQLIRIGKSCIRQGHFSTCRGIMWKFRISGISRVCSHQLVRHHVGIAINQASNVYMDAAEDEMIYPPSILGAVHDVDLKEDITNHIAEAKKLYTKLRERGISQSDSRYLLPQGMETAMHIALTPEALIHLAHERLCSRAQWEIRGVVQRMCKQVITLEPFWKDYLVPKCVYLHGCPEQLGCGYYNSYVNNTRINTAEHIERRLKIETCDNCGRQLAYKDDDPNPMIQDGGSMYCKECAANMGLLEKKDGQISTQSRGDQQ